MRLHTFDDIRRTVSASALDKATRYQRRHLARVTTMARDGTSIQGEVKGSQRRPYSVSIEIQPNGDGRVTISGACTCPVGFNCKHVAALLIESMSRNGAKPLAAPAPVFVPLAKPAATPPPPSPPPPPVTLPPVTLPPEAEGWLASLDRELALSEEAYAPTVRQRLIYVLHVGQDQHERAVATLELVSIRVLKDGSVADRVYPFAMHTIRTLTPAKFLLASDLAILDRFSLLPRLYGFGERARYALSGEAGAEVLERVLATGRCRWQTATGPVMSRAEPRQGRIGWSLTDDGALKTTVSIEGGGAAAQTSPLWYIDEETSSCGLLETDLPPRVATALLQAPAVHPRDVALLRDKLAQRLSGRLGEKLGDRPELLPTPPPPAETISGPPVPVLRLACRPCSQYERWQWSTPRRSETLQVAQPCSAYGSFVLSPGDRRDQPTFVRDGRLYAIERNPAAEARQRKRSGRRGHRARVAPFPVRGLPAAGRQGRPRPCRR